MPLRCKILASWALVLACSPLLAAQTTAAVGTHPDIPSGTATPAASPVGISDYVVSPDDILVIGIYDAPDISGEYRVSPAGQIALPLLSAPIQAAGQTLDQLAKVISDQYRAAEIFSHPRVTVQVKESRIHAVTVAGAVKKPQIYPVFGKTTLLDAISQAEGLTDDAGSLAIITRGGIAMQAMQESGACGPSSKQFSCARTFSVDLSRLSDTGDPTLNVDLYPGDRVTVQRAGIVYVVGAVNRPGGFPLKSGQQDMTVIQAVALAEDLKSTAARKKAMIIRRNSAASNGREEIAVNLTKVLEGHEVDTRLRADDILFVPESAALRALHRGTEAAVTAATYGVIYRW